MDGWMDGWLDCKFVTENFMSKQHAPAKLSLATNIIKDSTRY